MDVQVAQGPIANLGAVFDSSLNMSAQVSKMVKTASFHLRNIGRVRKRLTTDATKKVVQSLVISRLDYCNALLCGVSDQSLSRLQRVQNNAARLITKTSRRDHITPILVQLHWLPIRVRIDFKILLLVYKTLHGKAPKYICDLLNDYQPRRQLRSMANDLLEEPKANLVSSGDRAFSVYAPRLWNKLELNIRQSDSVESFKSKLKSHLFQATHLL